MDARVRQKCVGRCVQSEGIVMEEKEIELRDEGLRGNEKIEEAIAGLQQEPTQEMLAHVLTVVRRRMKENGQLIVAVEPRLAADSFCCRPSKRRTANCGGLRLPDLRKSFAAATA